MGSTATGSTATGSIATGSTATGSTELDCLSATGCAPSPDTSSTDASNAVRLDSSASLGERVATVPGPTSDSSMEPDATGTIVGGDIGPSVEVAPLKYPPSMETAPLGGFAGFVDRVSDASERFREVNPAEVRFPSPSRLVLVARPGRFDGYGVLSQLERD